MYYSQLMKNLNRTTLLDSFWMRNIWKSSWSIKAKWKYVFKLLLQQICSVIALLQYSCISLSKLKVINSSWYYYFCNLFIYREFKNIFMFAGGDQAPVKTPPTPLTDLLLFCGAAYIRGISEPAKKWRTKTTTYDFSSSKATWK